MAFPDGLPALPDLVADPVTGYAPTLADFNDPRSAIRVIIAELGAAPEGAYPSISDRLAAIAATAGTPGPAGPAGPQGIQGPVGPAGPAGAGGGNPPVFDADVSADTPQGPGWSKFHTCPAVTVAGGAILDYSWILNGNSGYTHKCFQVILTTDDVAPSNNRVNGQVVGFQPNYVDDYFPCRLLVQWAQSGTFALRMWGRFCDYDPNPNAAYASTGVSFTVKKANSAFGMFRGVIWGY